MSYHEISLEFYNEAQHLDRTVEGELHLEVTRSLLRLQQIHPGLQKVVIALEQPVQREFSSLYLGKVVVYDHVRKISAMAREATPLAALQEALVVLEAEVQKRCVQHTQQRQPASLSFAQHLSTFWHELQDVFTDQSPLRRYAHQFWAAFPHSSSRISPY